MVRQDRAIAVAEGLGILPDEVQRAVPMLLHGPIAAAVLSLKLGVVDSDVLNAIRYHTTCRAGASELELVVFVADKIALDPSAPVRDFVPEVRAAAERSLQYAALAYLAWVVDRGPELGWQVHSDAIAAYQELETELLPG